MLFRSVVALFFVEEVADLPDRLPELVIGSGGGLSDQGLDLGECHFDWVQVGGVGGQEQKPGPDVFQDRGGLWAFVGGEVVEVRRIRK